MTQRDTTVVNFPTVDSNKNIPSSIKEVETLLLNAKPYYFLNLQLYTSLQSTKRICFFEKAQRNNRRPTL